MSNLNGLEGDQDMGLGDSLATVRGPMLDEPTTQKAHSNITHVVDKANDILEIPQAISLDKTKHTAIRIVSQQNPNFSGPKAMDEPKEGDSMLQRSGGMVSPLITWVPLA